MQRPARYMEQKLTELRREIDNSATIVGDISTLLLTIGRTTRQKISKEIEYIKQ